MLTNTFPKAVFLYLFVLSVKGVFGADTDEVKSVSVTEGDSVSLNSDVTEVLIDDQILWMFGPEDTRIAEIYNQKIKLFNIERFRERLQMDNQTGSLTIRNIRSEHTGLYKLQILRRGTSYKRFNVTVYTSLPVPVITRDHESSSSSQRCSLVCSSVLNVSAVTLSWYKGISVLSSISVSDHNNNISLPLEVEYQDKNTYSCVVNNPIRNKTKHLDISRLCHTSCADNQTLVLAASISAVLLVVLAGLMYFLYWKRKRMGQKGNGYEPSAHTVEIAQTERDEVQYAETGFFKQNGQRKKAEKEETIYSSIVT